ncbi:MAG: PepSY domain-containing protein [Telmatospirillum sp.]|nr:PepSY domain-containing protein [Telmatospirillum sp.]
MVAIARNARRWLRFCHRWTGLLTAPLFVLWLLSGLVMMYVPFPDLPERQRMSWLDPIAWDQVRLSPRDALAAAGWVLPPRDLRLEMERGQPVYRVVDWSGRRQRISAVDGTSPGPLGGVEALEIARRLPGGDHARMMAALEWDQWTVSGRYHAYRPLYRLALDDRAGTEIYLSAATGEVVLSTTLWQRGWNWLGAVPHWIYLSALRSLPESWRQAVLWLSGAGIVAAASGLAMGVLRLGPLHRRQDAGGGGKNRPAREARADRFRSARAGFSPYRGWMLWHHWAGLGGGLFLLTWVASGWLSVNPNGWFDRGGLSRDQQIRYAAMDPAGPVLPSAAALPAGPGGAGAVEARFIFVGGREVILLSDRSGDRTVIDGVSGMPAVWDDAVLFRAAAALYPDARLVRGARLTEEDAYWYSHHRHRPLPVLRAEFDDENRTWVHIDPGTGELLGRLDRSDRQYRWLFHAAHSLDFGPLLRHRPAWDLVVWILSAAGLAVSISGLIVGWRRLARMGRP